MTGTWFHVVGRDVVQVEALGQVEVDLHRAELPAAAERVLQVELDLRPVERALAGRDLVLEALGLDAVDERRSDLSQISSVPRRTSGRVAMTTRTSLNPKSLVDPYTRSMNGSISPAPARARRRCARRPGRTCAHG
jgi:hypothetical protein